MARAYVYKTDRTSPNQGPRPRGQRPTSITIHWWGKPVGQKMSGIVDWLCTPAAKVSAHYVVSRDTVACIVDPDRRAWHAGSGRGNDTSIGIECDPNASARAETMRTVAALVADLRGVYGDLPLLPHRHWTSTECPGDWDLAELDRLARGHAPAKPKPSKPAPASAPPFPLPRRQGAMCVYGARSGPSTHVSGMTANALAGEDVQAVRGRWHSLGLAVWQQRMIDRGWSELVTAGGADGRFGATTEKVVRQFQQVAGLTVDGVIGPETWAAAWTEPVR